jgi:hypothetical protein
MLAVVACRRYGSGRAQQWREPVGGEYPDAHAACGRGEKDTAMLLAYDGVPLLLTTDDGSSR